MSREFQMAGPDRVLSRPGPGAGHSLLSVIDPPRSRVHELGRMRRTQLVEVYQRLAGRLGYCESTMMVVQYWDRDHLIAAIREQEDRAARMCRTCDGTAWVCEAHPDKAWNQPGGCNCSPGVPCPTCQLAEMRSGVLSPMTRGKLVVASPKAHDAFELWDHLQGIRHRLDALLATMSEDERNDYLDLINYRRIKLRSHKGE